MRILICGGRAFADRVMLADAMAEVAKVIDPQQVACVIHGGAPGADTLGGLWAKERGIPVEVFPADWKAHGKAAGPIRNAKMLAEGKPDMVVAMPGGRGTADMVRKAITANVPTRVSNPAPRPTPEEA